MTEPLLDNRTGRASSPLVIVQGNKMDHRTTSQEASPNGHQKPENAAPAHTPTPWSLGSHNLRAVTRDAPGIADGRDHYMVAVTSSHSLILPDEAAANAAFIVKAVNTYASNTAELLAAYERIAKLEADLHECREYLEDRASMFDDGHGGVSPNRAMQLVSSIDETLNGPGAF